MVGALRTGEAAGAAPFARPGRRAAATCDRVAIAVDACERERAAADAGAASRMIDNAASDVRRAMVKRIDLGRMQ